MTRLAGVAGGDPPVARVLPADVLWRYLRRQPELNKPHVPADLLAVRDHRYNLGVIAYPVATAISCSTR